MVCSNNNCDCQVQFSFQLSLHSKLCHVNTELQVVYTCTSMVRVSCTKLPVFRFAWQSLWTDSAKSQCLQMLIANSPGLSRTLTDTAQTPGFPYGSPNLLDKMAFEPSGIQAPTTPANPPPPTLPPQKFEVYSMFFWQPFCSFSIPGREWGWLHFFLEPTKHCGLYIF